MRCGPSTYGSEGPAAKLLKVGIRVLRITDNRFEYDARDALEDVLAALGLGSSPN